MIVNLVHWRDFPLPFNCNFSMFNLIDLWIMLSYILCFMTIDNIESFDAWNKLNEKLIFVIRKDKFKNKKAINNQNNVWGVQSDR